MLKVGVVGLGIVSKLAHLQLLISINILKLLHYVIQISNCYLNLEKNMKSINFILPLKNLN